jgi:hypothetical protein
MGKSTISMAIFNNSYVNVCLPEGISTVLQIFIDEMRSPKSMG